MTAPAGPGGYPGQAPPGAATVAVAPTPPKGSDNKTIIAGIAGGLATLAVVTVAIFALTGDDDGGTDTTPTSAQGLLDDTSSTTDGATDDVNAADDADRIGTTVTGIGLLAGDCINYDNTGGNVSRFDVVTCGSPHLAEITAQAEHPAAGQDFPGIDELARWSASRCEAFTEQFVGSDVLLTTLAASTLVPDFNDWSDGLFRVSCIVAAADGSQLVESVMGRATDYARGDAVVVGRLRPGDCFNPQGGTDPFDLRAVDTVDLVDCGQEHVGLFFGRDLLAGGAGALFPGQETVDSDSIDLCNQLFATYFSVPVDGLNYRYWNPDQSGWNLDDRAVNCAVIDEGGLPPTLDYREYRRVFDLGADECFVFGPEEATEVLSLDDRVDTVGCDEPHNGQLFATGELSADGRDFPGDDALDTEAGQLCAEAFTEFTGVDPANSEFGSYRYWFPTETGWDSGDLRWACAYLDDDPFTGPIN